MKRVFCILLLVVLLWAASLALAQAAETPEPRGFLRGLSDSFEGQETPQPAATPEPRGLLRGLSDSFEGQETPRPMDSQTYELGADVLASVPAIVGSRDCIESGAGSGGMQEYTYQSDTVRDDLLTYIDYLGEQGFEVVRGASLAEPGEGELTGPSQDAGRQIHIALDWTLESYHLRFTKTGEPTATGMPQPMPDFQDEVDWDLVEQGTALIDEGDSDGALALFDAAIARQPDIAAYHFWRSQALEDIGRRAEAYEAVAEAIRLDPNYWGYHNSLGDMLWTEDRMEEAIAAYRKAADLNPSTDDAHFNLTYVYNEVEKWEEAVQACTEGLALFPESQWLWWQLAEAQVSLGNYDEALAAFEKVFAYSDFLPEDFDSYQVAKEKAGGPSSTGTPATLWPTPSDGGETRLLNYEDWIRPFVEVMPYQPSMLDGFMESRDLGGGLVQEAIEYPREWPSPWLDGIIPEYTGTGWMFDVYVVHPNMSYAAEDLRHVAVTVYAYDQAELDAYVAGLAAYGLQEITDSPYVADWIQAARSFQNDDYMLTIVTAEGEGASFKILSESQDPEAPEPFVQFNVDFFRDAYIPDTTITEDTELLNYEQWCDLMDTPADQRYEMDLLTDATTDEYGRLYETIYFPSQWPKDVFGEMIPEFTLPGAMYYMVVTTPAATPTRDQTLIASMYLVGHAPEDVEQYAREIAGFGYREVPEEEYTEQEISAGMGHDAYHIFSLPSVRCIVAAFDDDGVDMMQITLRWDGRYNNFFDQ